VDVPKAYVTGGVTYVDSELGVDLREPWFEVRFHSLVSWRVGESLRLVGPYRSSISFRDVRSRVS
jgi:hypothetical protein